MNITPEPHCQLVKLVALFPVGRMEERKKGLAQSVANMLKKSTQKNSHVDLQKRMDRYGMSIEVYSSPLYFTAELHCHKLFITQSIPLLFEVLFEATFSEKIWKIVRDQTIENILQNQNQTDFMADKLLSEHVIGMNHPLGYYSEPEDYMQISLDDITSFYQTYIQKTKPSLYLAGDVGLVEKKWIEEQLTGYSIHPIVKRQEILLPTVDIRVISKKLSQSSQTSVRLGKLIPRDSFQDFIHLEILNTFVGGYYLSELMKTLRIQHGYTYGVYSYLIHFPHFSFLQIGYETDKIHVDKSLEAIKGLFDRLYQAETLDYLEAKTQYYSQFSKNAERSLQEMMYKIRIEKLGYQYDDYKTTVENYTAIDSLLLDKMKWIIFEYQTYSKSIIS